MDIISIFESIVKFVGDHYGSVLSTVGVIITAGLGIFKMFRRERNKFCRECKVETEFLKYAPMDFSDIFDKPTAKRSDQTIGIFQCPKCKKMFRNPV